MSDSPLIRFVRALARHQARQDAAAGIVDESIERYANDPSEQNTEAVVASMGRALEDLFLHRTAPAAERQSSRLPSASQDDSHKKELPRILTPSMLAEEWACSERHVRNLITQGKLPHFKLGGKLLRIRREDVEAFEISSSEAPRQDENPPKRERAKRLDRGR